MESTITSRDLENFWIRAYLGAKRDLIEAAIDKAYLDFNRTQHGFAKVKTEDSYPRLRKVLESIIKDLLVSEFESQADFDEWHECKCNYIIDCYDEITEYAISFGQAQKWINMSIKYLYALGDTRIPGISTHYRYFHIPIDNIIQDKLKKVGINRLNCSWSRLETYNDYMNYQRAVRERFDNRILMDIEFELFNQAD